GRVTGDTHEQEDGERQEEKGDQRVADPPDDIARHAALTTKLQTVCRMLRSPMLWPSPCRPPVLLLAHQHHILVRRRIGVAGNQAKPRFPDPRPGAVNEGQLPNRRVYRPLL